MNFYSMVYSLTTQWRRCEELRPQTLLLRHYNCLTVSYMDYWFGGGGVSSAPICTLSCVNEAGLPAWLVRVGGGGGVE
jgi:hypothetical protein